MTQVLEILSLQAIDDEAAAFRAALADVQRRLQGDQELDDARRRLGQAEISLAAIRKDQRRVEAEVEGLSDKIAREDKRLYDGSIKNPKELTNLQHEVDLLKAARGKFEDELIAVLDAGEAASREQKAAARAVTSLEARWQHDLELLHHEALRLTDLISRGDVRREMQKAKVTPRALLTYEDLRRRKGGMAVARIVGGTCMGCRVTIPDSLRRQALAPAGFAQCPNCERILTIG
ncbi:MAG: zinc ribbon domain-containing protein [Dehalococcoidia bacterium]